jgi:hypothetical protein
MMESLYAFKCARFRVEYFKDLGLRCSTAEVLLKMGVTIAGTGAGGGGR